MSIEDRAQEHEQQEWERRNVLARRAPPPAAPTDPDYGPERCDECEDNMPALRRSYRCRLCTSCQTALERSASRR